MGHLKSFLVLLSVTFSAAAGASSKHCIAEIDHQIGYASFAHYNVDCGDEKFKTPTIVTSYLLPLPYNWGGVVKNKLDKVMVKRSMTEVAKIKAESVRHNMIGKNLLIYVDKIVPDAVYALVTMSNPRTIGLGVQKTVWDVRIEYSNPNFRGQSFQGLNQEEINDLRRRERLLKTNVSGLYIYQ
jgi:hypothetical protein